VQGVSAAIYFVRFGRNGNLFENCINQRAPINSHQQISNQTTVMELEQAGISLTRT
jgi:hypothetical protein